jgi:hypothetical protein
VEKIKRVVLERFLWKRLNAKIAAVVVTVLYKNILICMECVLVQAAHATKG